MQNNPESPRSGGRPRKPNGRARLIRLFVRPNLPTKVVLASGFAAAAYASFQAFTATYAPEGAAEMRPVIGGLFALSVFAVGWIVSRRPPRRFD
ncbi:MAG: hypothetical protein O2865_02400 [Planctomycetota bacterium]|nr:hypothetical protein [Planctomycetota bacterium]MDA0931965.1 hypothetical protein [Planctomycetota bacterium]MDA1223310.1 hypothetical protein [Planctomycetota bacterium]